MEAANEEAIKDSILKQIARQLEFDRLAAFAKGGAVEGLYLYIADKHFIPLNYVEGACEICDDIKELERLLEKGGK